MTMKKLTTIFMIALCASYMFSSCNKYETYADKKKKENSAINSYIAKNKVKVISEKTFAAQGYTTDVTKNEYVLFDSNGIYLQIIRKGCGSPLKNGVSDDILVRFTERNLLTDTIQATNDILYFSSRVEKMNVKNTSGTFTGSFDKTALMYQLYKSQSVPGGWLFPLTYVNIGFPEKDSDEIAKIRIIVPSSQGHAVAAQRVYPCLYDLTYQFPGQ